MNDMLSYLLTYKLKGEDVVRASGVPATIIRPCALTEEPAGAPMIVGQGDNLKGKISRRVAWVGISIRVVLPALVDVFTDFVKS